MPKFKVGETVLLGRQTLHFSKGDVAVVHTIRYFENKIFYGIRSKDDSVGFVVREHDLVKLTALGKAIYE